MNCPKCNETAAPNQAFCENCGAPLKGGVVRKRAPRKRVSHAEREYARHIKHAQITIFVVAALSFLAALMIFLLMQSRFSGSWPTDVLVMFIGQLVVGIIYIGLGFWSASNPFAASLTTLILFITLILIGAVINPASILMGGMVGIGIKIVIILCLLSGIKSSLGYRRLKARQQASAR